MISLGFILDVMGSCLEDCELESDVFLLRGFENFSGRCLENSL